MPFHPDLPRTFLNQEEIDAFHDKGYHIHDALFDAKEVAAIREACAAVCDEQQYETTIPPDEVFWHPGDDPLAVRKVDNCWKANEVIREAVTHPRLGHIAAQLLDAPGIRLWQDQYLYKPAQGGKTVTWHQDWAYWQMIAECRTITCWIALCDVMEDMGPMRYWPWSHKEGLQDLPEAITGDDEALPAGANDETVPVILKAGQVAFHHGLLLHGSDRNTSDTPRISLVAHTMSTECTYKPGQSHINETRMLEQKNAPQPGEALAGPQFPMMWMRG